MAIVTKRSTTGLYGLVLMTSGYYAFFWLISIMRDVNEFSNTRPFNVGGARRFLLTILAAYFSSVAYLLLNLSNRSMPGVLPWLTLLLGLTLATSLAFFVIRVHKVLGDIHPSGPRKSTAAMIGLTLFFAASLIILQAEVNAIVDLRRSRAPGLEG